MRATIATLLLLGACATARADDAGTQSPFHFGVGARELGLGAANMATPDFTTAAFWNAARLARAQRYGFSLFHSRLYDSDVAYQYIGLSIPTVDFGAFGIGIARLGVGGIERRDAGNVLLGMTNDERIGLYLAYGRTVAGTDIGLTIALEHHSLDDYSATSSPGLNFAISRRLESQTSWFEAVTISATGSNLVKQGINLVGERVNYPYQFDGGVTARFFPGTGRINGVEISARVVKTDAPDPMIALGMEFDIAGSVHARGGLRDGQPSIGAGLDYKSMRIDYALVGRDLGGLHMFTLSTFFGQSVDEKRRRGVAEREAKFATLMSEKVSGRNQDIINDLVEQGHTAFDEEKLAEARQYFDRALFMAVSSGADTTAIHQLLQSTESRLSVQALDLQLAEHLDSATAKFAAQDFIAARYFARLAETLDPASSDATMWRQRAEVAITEMASADEVLQERLAEIDSLINYGRIAGALTVARSLAEFAPENPIVQSALRRAQFEGWRDRAIRDHERGRARNALNAIDSALILYPGHQWCLDLKQRIRKETAKPVVPQVHATVEKSPQSSAEARTSKPTLLSAELTREVSAAYRDGQNAFQGGDLDAAVAHWEKVERIAPDYQSVRAYLVKSYRLAGVELYGRNLLADAITIWRKAEWIDPGNTEIRSYIERTEAEISHLKELSYDQ